MTGCGKSSLGLATLGKFFDLLWAVVASLVMIEVFYLTGPLGEQMT